MLYPCRECQADVSEFAEVCPRCGCPTETGMDRATLTEHTAKRWKLFTAVGGSLLVVGALFAVVSSHRPGFVFWTSLVGAAVGLALYLHGRVGAWWHHG